MDRQGRVDELTKQWRMKIWEPKAAVVSAVDFENFPDKALPGPSVVEVRAAAKSFSRMYGVGSGQLAPQMVCVAP